jgi:hypothetical protein
MGILQWLNGLCVDDQGCGECECSLNLYCESRKERRLRMETRRDRHCRGWLVVVLQIQKERFTIVAKRRGDYGSESSEDSTVFHRARDNEKTSRDTTMDEPLGTMQRNSTHIEYNQRCLSQTYSLVKCSCNPSVGRGIWEVSLASPNSRPAKNWVEVAQSRNRSTIYVCLTMCGVAGTT